MQTPNHIIFDRDFYKTNIRKSIKKFDKHDFLVQEVSSNITDRLHEFSQKFDNALIYGLFKPSLLMLKPDQVTTSYIIPEFITEKEFSKNRLVFDEEVNPCKDNSFNLIISNLTLNFVNDLPGALIQYKKVLNQNGLFIATMFGPQTLKELKSAFIKTDEFFYQGSTPHIIPFIDIKDGAALLQRVGFTQSISDSYTIEVKYSSLYNLLYDIKGMGQSNCLINRNKSIPPKNYFAKLAEIYKEERDLTATFEIITITGLKA